MNEKTKDFLSSFWRAFLFIAGLFILFFGLPSLVYCLFGGVAAIIALIIITIISLAGLIAALIAWF